MGGECIWEYACVCLCVHWLWVQRARGAHRERAAESTDAG